MEPDDLLCSRNARSRTPLVGRAQWKIDQPPSLRDDERAWREHLYRSTCPIEDQPGEHLFCPPPISLRLAWLIFDCVYPIVPFQFAIRLFRGVAEAVHYHLFLSARDFQNPFLQERPRTCFKNLPLKSYGIWVDFRMI